jgi:hypothetical protein
MRRALAALLLLLTGACRGKAGAPPPLPKFDIDVEVMEGWTAEGEPDPETRQVVVRLTDLDAGCVRDDSTRPEPGKCGGWSDVIGPGCGTWHCVHEIRVEHAGGAPARANVPRGTMGERTVVSLGVPAHLAGARVIIEGCGQRAELPISTELPSAPEVTGVSRGVDGFEVAWTGAADAAMIEVYAGSGFGGTICAQREREPAKFPLNSHSELSSLVARSAIVEHSTPFGRAHVWRTTSTPLGEDRFVHEPDVPGSR